MSADLDALQKRLEDHFKQLSATRRERGLPVFVLEHGLSVDELSLLTKLLKAKLAASASYRLSTHWLAWIVFATEQGYDYDGDEYWHTFAQRMPNWDHGRRSSIRSWFGRFHEIYGGLRPVGPWASNFSIIAWPITHALLPKDLQAQLAHTLYNLRYNLIAHLDKPVGDLGRYIARMTYDGSSRYMNFLEQKQLVGSIVLALVGHRTQDGSTAILRFTLDRIVKDLERARSARQWLYDTRKAVESARISGATRRVGDGAEVQREARPSEHKPAIRPTLLLRRTETEAWTPIIEIPCFREVADLSPELGGFLRATRCEVAGSPGWRPPGWLLTGAQRRVLEAWPAAGKPVLSFQKVNATLDHLLVSEGCIRAGPTWLFRIGSDGQAREVLARLIRPSHSYVLVTRGNPPVLSMATATTIHCRGVTAVQFQVPAKLSQPQIDEFRKADLSIAETIRVWPVGLAARGWDGEGTTEWLVNESPCFAIEHDHPVAHYQLRLGAGASVKVSAKPPGEPTFVRLRPLPAGNHVLSVGVARIAAEAVPRIVEGLISLTVRPPNPWTSGTIGHTGLIVSCDPPSPTLDNFWEGLTQLQVMGPAGRQVAVCVELLDGTGSRLGLEQVSQLTLPLGPDSWRNAFSAFAKMEKQPWNYLSASSGRIIVDGEELGVVHIPLQRDVAPVRWVWHEMHRSMQLRLVDHHDSETPLEVMFFPFGRPVEATTLTAEAVAAGTELPSPGGLFVATYGDKNETLVVSSRKLSGGLGGLLIEPAFGEIREKPEEALALVKAIGLWSAARLTGPLAAQRRDSIVTHLKERLYYIFLGSGWAQAEANLRSGKLPVEAAVEGLLRCFNDKRAFGVILARDAHKYAQMAVDVRERELASLAGRYKIAPGALVKPAIDLGEVIGGRLKLLDADVLATIEHLWDCQALNAGARLIQLLGNRTTPFGPLDAGGTA
ncbi:hypothetical protein [Nitrospirillum viridazoti]|uniref:Uncharacterized protein n=1 Tax=Nitrospirillum amazonense TaxID=28077 RepID=A0A560HP70_9PROT|nr:hypothetical protein [Nitrospirillum amazonense]TWB48255.1 hypothetical protein FBZ92_13039 [Nitrospirillum amazonense]